MTAEPVSTDNPHDPVEPEDRSTPEMLGIEHVDGDARNVFVGNRGAITTHEEIHWHFTPERVRRGPVLLARADEGELGRLFVAPRGWEEARQELVRERTVLITGAPHTGRRTAGWCLLAAVSDGKSREVQRSPLKATSISRRSTVRRSSQGTDCSSTSPRSTTRHSHVQRTRWARSSPL
jgi:hypothetical protein